HIPGPVGVRGRNSDNTLIKEKLDWEPAEPLRDGMAKTYQWINQQVEEKYPKYFISSQRKCHRSS
ncbi:MAG: hypothetical protein VW943_01955, partial [Flavobacteriaceae bacterium]